MTGPFKTDLASLVGALSALGLVVLIFWQPLAEVRSTLGFGSPGFLMQVTSEPVPGTVEVDGVVRGTTPYFGNVRCRAEERVQIRVLAEGRQPWQREVECRQGGTLEITARLADPAYPSGH